MKIIEITENDANQRLDRFLCKLFPNATKSLIYKFNRKNKIKIQDFLSENKKFTKKNIDYKIKVWDKLKIFLNGTDYDTLIKNTGSGPQIKQEENKKFNKKDIIYEDNDILVINKNPWVNVHPWDYKTKESNIIYQIQDYLSEKLNSLTFKPSLIHRLDRNTSGVLMIWKKKDMLVKITNDFKNIKKIKKTYYAIVLWKLSRKSWTIKKKLKRIENPINENKVQISSSGQEATTHYKLIKEYEINLLEDKIIVSELEIEIETWRMHQIRIHMSSLGNPIVWDETYWNKKLNNFFRKNYWLDRQALHSWKIEFFHYNKNKKMKLTAEVKKDLVNFIYKINKNITKN